MDPAQLILDAIAGDETARSTLLELYRNYLRLLARVEVGRRLQCKIDESDIVQEAMQDAQQQFGDFNGTDERQFAAWLRRILAGKVAILVRHYFGTPGCDRHLEQELENELGNSSRLLGIGLGDAITTSSEQSAEREQSVLLANALEKLRPELKDVIVLHYLENLTFPEIAGRMGRTQDSVEKLWVRALAQLRGRPPRERNVRPAH